MVVIEYKQHITRKCHESIYQNSEHGLDTGRPQFLQPCLDPLCDSRMKPVQGSDDIPPEAHQFVIITLKGDPCCHCLTLLNPRPDQGGFTKASRCRYQGKWYVHPGIKLAVQARPRHNSLVRDCRNGQFGCKQEVITITTFHRQTPFFASTFCSMMLPWSLGPTTFIM